MFTAIPVGQGDAFLLQRKSGLAVLVDGGRSRISFPSQVSRIIKGPIDVVVCTHADADHAEGLIGLLEVAETPVKEVWLPGRWTALLKEIIRRDIEWLSEIAQDVQRTKAARLEGIELQDEVMSNDRVERVKIPELDEILADDDVFADVARLFGLDERYLLSGWFHIESKRQKLWLEAMSTAERIRSIALAAHHHGAKVRWFDFDEAQVRGPGGGENFLRPINSRELVPGDLVRRPRALAHLALSVANQESLVFAAPETDCSLGVVFTADSGMVCSRQLPKFHRPVVVTAPHHGSEANSIAYPAIDDALGPTPRTWVRSDGRFRKRPGATFLSQRGTRACTLCRGGSTSKQPVVLKDNGLKWVLNSRACGCK